jgi:dolichol-phosphate mannosyltransferase
MDAIPQLSLVIPAFNEADVIARAVIEAEQALAGMFDRFEILVVDDGSSDRTVAEVQRIQSVALHTRLIQHGVNGGYGAALRSGFEVASSELVAFTDADCQFDLRDLNEMVALTEQFPIVAGYRLNRQDAWRRRFLSRGYNLLARTLLDTRVRDIDCALKVFRREVLANLLPESRGFFVNTEMLMRSRQLGYEVIEMPVTHRPRLGGTSKVSLREVPRTMRTLLAFWWKNLGVRRSQPVTVLQARVATPAEDSLRDAAPPLSNSPARPVVPRERNREAA